MSERKADGIQSDQREMLDLVASAIGPVVKDAIETQMALTNVAPPIRSPIRAPGKPTMASVPKGMGLARCVRYLHQGQNDIRRAINAAREDGNGELAEHWEEAVNLRQSLNVQLRAAGQDTLAGGGALIPPGFVSEFIEELGADAVVRASGLASVPLRGSLTIPFVDTAPTAAYVGEAANATASTGTLGQLILNERKLVGLSPVSNELMDNGGASADSYIKGTLSRSVARKEDLTFLTGSGVSTTPKGMLNWCPAANKFDANGTSNLANTRIDIAKAINKLMTNDVSLNGAAWFISPGTYQWFSELSTTTGALAYPLFESSGKLAGIPYFVSSQIVENTGTGSNESKIYLGNMSQGALLGENQNMTLEVFPNGAYYDGSSVVSGISTDQSVVRVISRHDFGARYRGKEFAVIEAVLWSRA